MVGKLSAKIIELLFLLFLLLSLSACDKTPTDNDGEEHRIFFSSFWLNHSEVYFINADGSNKMQIVDGGIMTSPPVNNKITFYSNIKNQSTNRIFTATSEGKNVLQIAKSVDSHLTLLNSFYR